MSVKWNSTVFIPDGIVMEPDDNMRFFMYESHLCLSIGKGHLGLNWCYELYATSTFGCGLKDQVGKSHES